MAAARGHAPRRDVMWMPRLLLLAVAATTVAEVIVIAPSWSALLVVLTIGWMALPGVVLVRRALGARDPSGLAAWFIGPAIGFGFSVFGALLVWAGGLHNWMALAGGPLLTWLAAALAGRCGGLSLRLPAFDRRDLVAVAIVLLIVPLVTFAPYDHVREPVADGEAYRAYFTADFVWAMTVTAELAKGQVPPANPFIRGGALHYYWMAHFLSGALYRNVGPLGVTAEQVILLDGLGFGLAFVLFFYALTRMACANPAFAALGVAAGFLANSYEGFNRLWLSFRQGGAYSSMTTLNIDAVTRWFYQGMPVDGLQRMLLYQPHHLTGYALALAALWLVTFADDITEISVALWAGVLLGLGFLFSTFTAIIVGVALGPLFAIRLVAAKAWGATWRAAVLGAVPVAVAIAVSFALGYTDPAQGTLMQLGPNPVAFHAWPFMLLLSFGPLLFAGVVGLARVQWVKEYGGGAAALVVSALAFYFFVDVPDEQGVWVGWRSGHLLLISFSIIGAALLTRAWAMKTIRVPALAVALMALLPATATPAIDVYNAQDITNRRQGPGFPWTLIITPPEREALEWLRHNTRPTAVVQFEPHERGSTWWCYLTAFAERRMAAGLPGAMIPRRPYELATETVREGIFGASTARDAHLIAQEMQIDYLLIGPIERHFHRSTTLQLEKAPDLFTEVFRNATITILAVRR